MSFSDFLGSLFAGSYTQLPGLTETPSANSSVDQIFSGINYLQALATTNRTELSTYLNSGKFEYYKDGDINKDTNSKGDGTLKSSTPDSIFNKFSVFSYQNFMSGSSYKPEYHFIGAHNASTELKEDKANEFHSKINLETAAAEILKMQIGSTDYANTSAFKNRKDASAAIRRTSTILANPNVKNIIEWANETSSISITGYQPYAMTDFMFCRNYGKIPNNRLVTLRRYPFPVDDQIKVFQNNVYKSPIPIAQAVTWFGGDTGNTLAGIGIQNWGMFFKEIVVTEEQITGNEVTVSEISALVSSVAGGSDNAKAVVAGLEKLMVVASGSDAILQQYTGMEKKLQDYAKNQLYTNGPYWNRIFGPVNVVDRSTQRTRGMQPGWNKTFDLNFHYQFRSFSGLSPKIVALDLISSFLNLTYNDAQFLGQLARYFPRTGLKFNPTITEQIGKLITSAATTFDANITGQILELIKSATASLTAATGLEKSKNLKDKIAKGVEVAKRGAQVIAADKLKPAIPEILVAKSALSDRPVGEWHLVVGNPMNPIMVMGDLLCSSCSMTFDTEIGPEDFPTGVTFKLTLQQGKPRDKVAIERMFNLGESQLMFNKLTATASANDTFGEDNTKRFNELTTGTPETLAKVIEEDKAFQNYRNRIRRSYGYKAGGADSGKNDQETGDLNDSLLYMYFDKALEKV
jgi:hypothetical protein